MKFLSTMVLSTLMLFSSIQVSDAGFIHSVATLSGAAEAPPNASAGTGFAIVDLDTTLHTMRVQITFSGLTGTTTNSHIHAPTSTPGSGTASVATQTPKFVGFPSGVTSGSYDHTFDTTLASTWNAPYITGNGGTPAGAEAAMAAAIIDGKAYLNVHTSFIPAGEIRGFLHVVPEPSSIALLGMGFCGLIVCQYKRRKSAN
jgi:hypothetical protein